MLFAFHWNHPKSHPRKIILFVRIPVNVPLFSLTPPSSTVSTVGSAVVTFHSSPKASELLCTLSNTGRRELQLADDSASKNVSFGFSQAAAFHMLSHWVDKQLFKDDIPWSIIDCFLTFLKAKWSGYCYLDRIVTFYLSRYGFYDEFYDVCGKKNVTYAWASRFFLS